MAPAVSVVNDKVLQHNSELTSLVSRLSDEKRQLRSMVRNLEDHLGDHGSLHRQVCIELIRCCLVCLLEIAETFLSRQWTTVSLCVANSHLFLMGAVYAVTRI